MPSLIWTDRATIKDKLGFEDYRRTIVRVIQSAETPITIGVFGRWGSGKTSLMRMVEKDLKDTGAQTIWFDAWKYDKQDALWRSLLVQVLSTLREALPASEKDTRNKLQDLQASLYRDVDREKLGGVEIDWSQLIKQTTKGAVKLSLSFIPGWDALYKLTEQLKGKSDDQVNAVFDAIHREKVRLHEDHAKSLEQFQDRFAGSVDVFLKKANRGPFISIFVDDLDRCLPEKAIEVLEAIKLFLDVPGCVFILGVDRLVVETGIELKYTGRASAVPISGDDYLEKIVQVPFNLPPLESTDVKAFIESEISQTFPPTLAPVFSAGLEANPRKVKRTLNIFRLLWTLADERKDPQGRKLAEYVDPELLAKIVVIQVRFREVYTDVVEDPNLLGKLEEYFERDPQSPRSVPEETPLESGEAVARESAAVQSSAPYADEGGLVAKHGRANYSKALKALLRSGQKRFRGADVHPYVFLTRTATVELEPFVVKLQREYGEIPLSALHSLPTPPADFIGRAEEIMTLVHALEGGTTFAISGRAVGTGGVASLTGMGGIGKTALALAAADKLKPRYPDAQIYLELKGTSPTPLSATEAMVHVIHAFEPTADLRQASKEDIAALYASVLEGKRVLLLLDNALDAAQVRPLLPPHTCAALVTSRRYFTLPGLTPLRLDLLPSVEAQTLVLKICPRLDAHAAEVARLCGYVPLALRIAASTLAENSTLRVEDYMQDLGDRRSRLATLKSESDPSLDVEASIDASYALLSGEAQAHLRALAVFPAPFDASAAASVWGMEEKEAGAVLGDLVRYSLVEYDEGSGRYSLHDLVAGFGEARLGEEERTAAQLRHAQHYLQVARTANDLYLKGGENVLLGLKLFDGEWEHIRTGQAWAVAHAEGSAEARRLCSEYPDAAVYCLQLRLRARDRIGWLEPAAAAARQLSDKQQESHHLGNLGLAYWQLGEVRKAIEYHEQALAIAREIGDRQGEGADLGNLGNAYADLGEVRKAIEYHEQALVIARDIGDRRGEGNALGNLGLAYADLGEVRKAIEYYEQTLAIRREIGDRRGEGADLGNLGISYRQLGEVRKAIEYFEQALAIDREIGDRRGEGTDLFNLGIAHEELGDWPRALQHATDALAIFVAIEDPHAMQARQRVEELKKR